MADWSEQLDRSIRYELGHVFGGIANGDDSRIAAVPVLVALYDFWVDVGQRQGVILKRISTLYDTNAGIAPAFVSFTDRSLIEPNARIEPCVHHIDHDVAHNQEDRVKDRQAKQLGVIPCGNAIDESRT